MGAMTIVSSLRRRLLRRLRLAYRSLDRRSVPRCVDRNYWYEGILWEPTVRHVLADLLRPGDVAFDCGANVGGLATVMSRLVGPRGIVCAFEASPRVIGELQYNLVLQGCSNATAYHRAIHSDSKSLLALRFDPSHHHSDHVVSDGKGDTMVRSLALDDYVEETGIVPQVVKMDIEGAEPQALRGFTRGIEAHRPHLILELTTGDSFCYDFLAERGYLCWDCSTYQRIGSFGDLSNPLCNALFIHASKLAETPYAADLGRRDIALLGQTDFEKVGGAEYRAKRWIDLAPGRYHLAMDFASTARDDAMACGVATPAGAILSYEASSQFLAASYRDWIIDLQSSASIRPFFRALDSGFAPSFRLSGGRLMRLDGLSNSRRIID
jgi:FkbM family methyltransferase